MIKTISHPGFKKGFTLIETMTALLVIAVVAIGTIGFKYSSVTDARKGEKEATATRIALLINEGWRGKVAEVNSLFLLSDPANDPSNYNPVTQLSGTGINISGTNPYTVIAPDNVTYFITMTFDTTTYTDGSNHRMTVLTTKVYWPATSNNETSYDTATEAQSVTLTTYAEQGKW